MNLLILCTIHHHVPAKNWLGEALATLGRPSKVPALPSPDSLLQDEGFQLIFLGASETPRQVLVGAIPGWRPLLPLYQHLHSFFQVPSSFDQYPLGLLH